MGFYLTGDEDTEITEYFIKTAFPSENEVRSILNALEKANEGLSLQMLEQHTNLSRRQLEKVLKMLSVETPSPI